MSMEFEQLNEFYLKLIDKVKSTSYIKLFGLSGRK
jgi:hypothetical protein